MDVWAIVSTVLRLGVKYGPTALSIAHDLVHELQQHDDPAVRSAADEVHTALHGAEHLRPAR